LACDTPKLLKTLRYLQLRGSAASGGLHNNKVLFGDELLQRGGGGRSGQLEQLSEVGCAQCAGRCVNKRSPSITVLK
jgi:hypothetical protein